jgi:type III secretion protein T
MPQSLLIDIQDVLITIALTTPRAAVCLAILPYFSSKTLTGIMRNSVGLAIALPAALPTFLFVQKSPPDYLLAGILGFKEAIIGCIFGVVLSIPVWVEQSVGTIIDEQRSPIHIQSNNASIDQDSSATGGLLLQLVVVTMIQVGLVSALARIIMESYAIWMPYNLTPPFEIGHLDILIKQFAEMFWHIVVYGGPVLIPILLVDFTFAVIGVFSPNLQVSFAASPIKSLTGLFVLLVYWPFFSHYIVGDFSHVLDFARTFIDAAPAH